MKKLLAMVLCLVMVIGCGSAMASSTGSFVEGEWSDADCIIMGNMDIDVDTWMSAAETRALALACILVEIITVYEGEQFNDFFVGGTITSYLGWADLTEGNTLVAAFESTTGEMWVSLVILDTGSISTMFTSSGDAEGLMDSLSADGSLEGAYYVCEEDELMAGMEAIVEILESED